MEPITYLNQIKSQLATSPIIADVQIIEDYALSDRGYFRARLTLSNRDFLEVSEYFRCTSRGCLTIRYRYQWMDEARQQLKRRWDNVEHFPNLPNFPHHIHIGDESHVEPGQALGIAELIAWFEKEMNV